MRRLQFVLRMEFSQFPPTEGVRPTHRQDPEDADAARAGTGPRQALLIVHLAEPWIIVRTESQQFAYIPPARLLSSFSQLLYGLRASDPLISRRA
jgi:hypothetical protein